MGESIKIKNRRLFAFSTRGDRFMTFDVRYVFVCIAVKDRRYTFFPTLLSIDAPLTTFFSIVINGQ